MNAIEYLLARIRTAGVTERGASLVEYALLLTFIAIICIVAVQFLGSQLSDSFNSVGQSVDLAGT